MKNVSLQLEEIKMNQNKSYESSFFVVNFCEFQVTYCANKKCLHLMADFSRIRRATLNQF